MDGDILSVREFLAELDIIFTMAFRILPAVDRELKRWRTGLNSCPNIVLRDLGRSSILHKRFHAQGGSVYAAYPLFTLGHSNFSFALDQLYHIVRFIVAFQTISDYLDNLCDRAGCYDENAFSALHCSMLDALEPADSMQPDGPSLDRDYYRLYPHKNDGGYLVSLVEECKNQLKHLPSYEKVKPQVIQFTRLYCDLQIKKHADLSVRESLLIRWYDEYADRSIDVHRREFTLRDIRWWEFAAACGSTLGIFALIAASALKGLQNRDVQSLIEAYFPWIAGLHILLDYFIDQREDEEGGDLNFVSYYKNQEECRERLSLFVNEGFRRASRLSFASFHTTVVKGLLALYLSDRKVSAQGLEEASEHFFDQIGPEAFITRAFVKLFRTAGVV